MKKPFKKIPRFLLIVLILNFILMGAFAINRSQIQSYIENDLKMDLSSDELNYYKVVQCEFSFSNPSYVFLIEDSQKVEAVYYQMQQSFPLIGLWSHQNKKELVLGDASYDEVLYDLKQDCSDYLNPE